LLSRGFDVSCSLLGLHSLSAGSIGFDGVLLLSLILLLLNLIQRIVGLLLGLLELVLFLLELGIGLFLGSLRSCFGLQFGRRFGILLTDGSGRSGCDGSSGRGDHGGGWVSGSLANLLHKCLYYVAHIMVGNFGREINSVVIFLRVRTEGHPIKFLA